jgi:hypothetical protein
MGRRAGMQSWLPPGQETATQPEAEATVKADRPARVLAMSVLGKSHRFCRLVTPSRLGLASEDELRLAGRPQVKWVLPTLSGRCHSGPWRSCRRMLQVIQKMALCRCTLERGAQIAQDASAFPSARPAVGGGLRPCRRRAVTGILPWPVRCGHVRRSRGRCRTARQLVAGTVRRCRVSIAGFDLSLEDRGDLEVAQDS